RLPFFRRLRRQEELRLEEGEPRRHDKIVGGDLEPEASRLGDEVEILLGEREHRNLGEVDLLGARECKEKIERPLEALDVDDQHLAGRGLDSLFRRLPGGRGGVAQLLGRRMFGLVRHATGLPAASLTSAIASASANGSGACRKERALANRSAARPSSGGVARAVSSMSAKSPLQWSTTSQPAAITSRARSANGPPSAFMPMSSLITKPSSPIVPRITSRIITGEMVAGRRSS